MKTVKLFLVRHGNTFEKQDLPVMIGSQTDLDLTSKGLRQAADLVKFFSKENISLDALYAGNLKRQQQAATIIRAPQPSLQLISHACLNEIDYGKWEGLSVENIKENWPKQYANWVNKAIWPKDVFEGSELDKMASLQLWFNELLTSRPGQTVAAITSQGIIKLIISLHPQLLGAEKTLEAFRVNTGHFCQLEIGSDLEIKSWNQEPGRLLLEEI